jgi:hypothetical protein
MAQPLTAEQCEILAALTGHDATPADRTTSRVATRLNMSPKLLAGRLAELEARSPPLVRRVFDEEWQIHTWLPTEAGREAYAAGCGAAPDRRPHG